MDRGPTDVDADPAFFYRMEGGHLMGGRVIETQIGGRKADGMLVILRM